MVVINNNIKMLKMLLDLKASLDLKNKRGFTPLTLAADLSRKEVL
jgi:ankyrin repeat protein